jgi:signal transduction histidine kinase
MPPDSAMDRASAMHPSRSSGGSGTHLEALDVLSSIGQDITASLDLSEIFATIERHVGALLDTATLYIGLLDERREWIDVPLFVDGGKRGPSRRIRLDDPLRPAARAIRENREILREKTEEQARREDMPGTAITLSALFRPLSVHGKTFGVMSVQSQHAHAYGERERLIFRTICSYAAVALANAESHRRLAAIKPLEALVAISREITASLDHDRIFSAVERHVGELCEATTFYIGLLDESGQWLSLDFCISGGRRTFGPRIRLDDPSHPAASAVRECREVLADDGSFAGLEGGPDQRAPTLFHPLVAGSRPLGVMAVQSGRASGFDDRQILIVRTLCASVAVALTNADVLRQAQIARAEAMAALAELRDAQERLIRAEAMASLGRLVAGVAHEVNTPVGTAYTITSSLQARVEGFRELATGAALKRSDLTAFLEMVGEAARQLDANLSRASDLVRRFKDVAAERTNDDRRSFRLAGLMEKVVAHLRPELGSVSPVLDADPDLVLDSFPGALGRILTDLVLNAAVHAFPNGDAGTITLRARAITDREVEIIVADDGVGIALSDQPRIFDPFFTTRRGKGGTGLGLHIAWNLATQTLGGDLRCESVPGSGTTFSLIVPVSV